jgi:hypothetical protein
MSSSVEMKRAQRTGQLRQHPGTYGIHHPVPTKNLILVGTARIFSLATGFGYGAAFSFYNTNTTTGGGDSSHVNNL